MFCSDKWERGGGGEREKAKRGTCFVSNQGRIVLDTGWPNTSDQHQDINTRKKQSDEHERLRKRTNNDVTKDRSSRIYSHPSLLFSVLRDGWCSYPRNVCVRACVRPSVRAYVCSHLKGLLRVQDSLTELGKRHDDKASDARERRHAKEHKDKSRSTGTATIPVEGLS